MLPFAAAAPILASVHDRSFAAMATTPPRHSSLASFLRTTFSAATLVAATSPFFFPLPSLATTAMPAVAAVEPDISSDELRSRAYSLLDAGDDSAALPLLRRLSSLLPSDPEFPLLTARVLAESGDVEQSLQTLAALLSSHPFHAPALLEYVTLLNRTHGAEKAMNFINAAAASAREKGEANAVRDVRLVYAQLLFLQKRSEEALKEYEELESEDPKDYRPVFCQGVIYSLLDRNKEARQKFARVKEIAPGKFEVDAYLQTPLSRVRLFGTGDDKLAAEGDQESADHAV